MANALYDKGREMFLVASGGWKAGSVPATIVPYLISSYNVALTADTFLSDIPLTGNMWKARGTYLVNRTTTAGVADADDTVVAAVGSGGAATCHALILVNETNASNTTLLIAYIDTATGLPFLPNGADISVAFDNGTNRIFKL